jgi:hypothetical protein
MDATPESKRKMKKENDEITENGREGFQHEEEMAGTEDSWLGTRNLD